MQSYGEADGSFLVVQPASGSVHPAHDGQRLSTISWADMHASAVFLKRWDMAHSMRILQEAVCPSYVQSPSQEFKTGTARAARAAATAGTAFTACSTPLAGNTRTVCSGPTTLVGQKKVSS
mmetsp:Transcript_13598/g.31113  ORF Transcript_13598/g.31113 Transcript_13598/m.31113 type:complete len:121 (+) Transcript_13598:437-799(+)